MTVGEAVIVGLFCICVVFTVLVGLWGCVAAFERVMRRLDPGVDTARTEVR